MSDALPKVILSSAVIELQATHLFERLTARIIVGNPIADTLLEGRWEVEPPAKDSPNPPQVPEWISITPASFASNHVECAIAVDTRLLMADSLYERNILLYTNSSQKIHVIPLKISTAALPKRSKLPKRSLLMLITAFYSLSWIIVRIVHRAEIVKENFSGFLPQTRDKGELEALVIFMLWLGSILALSGSDKAAVGFAIGIGVTIALVLILPVIAAVATGAVFWILGGIAIGVAVMALMHPQRDTMLAALVGALFGASIATTAWVQHQDARETSVLAFIVAESIGFSLGLAGVMVGTIADFKDRGFDRTFAIGFSLLTGAAAIALGMGITFGFAHLWIVLAIAATGLPWLSLLLYHRFRDRRQRRAIAKYRQLQPDLVEP